MPNKYHHCPYCGFWNDNLSDEDCPDKPACILTDSHDMEAQLKLVNEILSEVIEKDNCSDIGLTYFFDKV